MTEENVNQGEAMQETTENQEQVAVPEKFKKIVAEIEQMSVIDLNELVKVFEKKFGVSAASIASAPQTDQSGDSADTGGGLVSLNLDDAGANKIQVIKLVKEVLGLGLKEAKEFVDSAPKPLKEGMKPEDAEEMKKQFEDVGATVSVG